MQDSAEIGLYFDGKEARPFELEDYTFKNTKEAGEVLNRLCEETGLKKHPGGIREADLFADMLGTSPEEEGLI